MQGAPLLAATADDACNVKVSDEDAYLSRYTTIKAYHKAVKELNKFGSVGKEKRKEKKEHSQLHAPKRAQPTAGKKRKNKIAAGSERIWTNHAACKIVFQPVSSGTAAPLHEERLIAV